LISDQELQKTQSNAFREDREASRQEHFSKPSFGIRRYRFIHSVDNLVSQNIKDAIKFEFRLQCRLVKKINLYANYYKYFYRNLGLY
jgi:hypothetical protein